MPDDLLTLVDEAESAAAALASSEERLSARRHADSAVRRLRESAQQLSDLAAVLADGRSQSEPQGVPSSPRTATRRS
jgi:hypothetical protein